MVTKVKVSISPAAKSYEISIGDNACAILGPIVSDLSPSGNAKVVSNPAVWQIVGSVIDESLLTAGILFDLIEIPDGEEYKTPETCLAVYDALTSFGAQRQEPIIAVGGGVVGDLAGFVAATYMRGVPFINVPTTLLAQVDSSIGGKTGVDLKAGKNLVGAFYQPDAVISDTSFLQSLPKREIMCGLAEVIKAALLEGGDFLKFMEDNVKELAAMRADPLTEATIRSARFKARIVEGDEKDLSGRRAILNYGHTFGHALEAASEYTKINHGEAVAAGLRFAATLGEKAGISGREVKEVTDALLGRVGLAAEFNGLSDDEIIQAMRADKKNTGAGITFILLEEPGKPVIREIDEDMIAETLKEMRR